MQTCGSDLLMVRNIETLGLDGHLLGVEQKIRVFLRMVDLASCHVKRIEGFWIS